jgi:transposase
MYLVAQRTRLKNRIHATLSKYALSLKGVSDIFGKRSRSRLMAQIAQLPTHTRHTVRAQMNHIDYLDMTVVDLTRRISETFKETEAMTVLQSIPGIGPILSVVLHVEVGDITRFSSPQGLASYAGTVPRVHASGGRVRYGKLRTDVNQYLKWAYSEAANSIVINRKVYPDRHVTGLYNRIRQRKGHQTAIGAVSRHLAEATYWILTKREPYRDPALRHEVSTSV